MTTRIITHRGLDPARPGYFAESSAEAFANQIGRGFGLEFDIQFTLDDVMIAVHDSDLKRITNGKDDWKIRDVAAAEILAMRFSECRLATVPEVLSLIAQEQVSGALSALHLKHLWQDRQSGHFVDMLLAEIQKSGIRPEQFIIFDVKPEIARYIKRRMPELQLAASVSHPYDIARYNAVVGGTLIGVNDLIANRDLYSWAWLDEWDLTGEEGSRKTLLNNPVFEKLRENGIQIALVTPELHAKSPGLLGGESHPDGKDLAALTVRLREILHLEPDAVCTDYPDMVKGMLV